MSRNRIMQWVSDLPSTRIRAMARQLFLIPIVLLLVYAGGAPLALADSTSVSSVNTWQVVSPTGSVEVQTMSRQLPFASGVTHVAVHQVTRSTQTYFGKLKVERHADQWVVTGWRAVELKANSHWLPRTDQHRQDPWSRKGQLQRIFLQEVRITLPYSAANGGWDVRSLERELERLGVKVKPGPTLPKPAPTPQLQG